MALFVGIANNHMAVRTTWLAWNNVDLDAGTCAGSRC